MRTFKHGLVFLWFASAPAALVAQQVPLDQLSEAGAYDAVTIAGFTLALTDVEVLIQSGTLAYDPATERFSFGPRIGSERQLRRELHARPEVEARPVADLYRANTVALPNAASQTLTVPSGYGPAIFSNQRSGLSFGAGIGGVSRVPYTDKPDGGLSFGVGFGNAFETVGIALGMSINDLSAPDNADRYSGSFQVSRYFWDGLSIGIGGENLLVRDTDGEQSYYLVGSWAFDEESSRLPFGGVVTLGVGSGRFANMTARDLYEGKDNTATGVFGALAVELTERANLIADWNGRNLTLGGAFRVPQTGISVRLGVRDVTGNSGDGPRLTGSASMTLARF